VSASRDGTVRVWNAQSRAHEQVGESFTEHPDVRKALFFANRSQVVSASEDLVLFWDAETRTQIAKPLHDRGLAFAISPDGNCIALKTDDNKSLEILNIQTGTRIGQRLAGDFSWKHSVVFSPDSQRIVTSTSVDRNVRIWDANTGAQIDLIHGPAWNTPDISFFPDKRHIMIHTKKMLGGTVTMFWDSKTHSQTQQDLSRKIDNLSDFSSLSPHGNQLASVSSTFNSVRIWSLEMSVRENLTQNNAFTLNSASYSPDGKFIVTACTDTAIRTWDAGSYSVTENPLIGHTAKVNSASFSPDGKIIVTASDDETICVWSAKTSAQIGEPLTGHRGKGVSVAFSPDGTCFVSADGSTIQTWSAGRFDLGRLIHAIEIPSQFRLSISSASFSFQEQFIAVNIESDPNTTSSFYSSTYTHVFDLKTGTVASFIPFKYRHSSVCFSPEKHLVLFFRYMGYDLHLWNVETHCIAKVFRGHTGTVRRASFSFDGKHIVSASDDHTIRVWNTESSSQIAMYLDLGGSYKKYLKTIEVSPDGKHILSVYHKYNKDHAQIWAMPDRLPSGTSLHRPLDNRGVG